MNYSSDDCTDYPGSKVPMLHVDFTSLVDVAAKIGVTVTTDSGGSWFAPALRTINIDTKTATERGFVSLGQLSDEYLHAWNQARGRGKYLDPIAAKEHRAYGAIAEKLGTGALVTQANYAFHKLEALNFFCADEHIPSFIWRTPCDELKRFALSWPQHSGAVWTPPPIMG